MSENNNQLDSQSSSIQKTWPLDGIQKKNLKEKVKKTKEEREADKAAAAIKREKREFWQRMPWQAIKKQLPKSMKTCLEDHPVIRKSMEYTMFLATIATTEQSDPVKANMKLAAQSMFDRMTKNEREIYDFTREKSMNEIPAIVAKYVEDLKKIKEKEKEEEKEEKKKEDP
jgi:hypothetical protein